MQLRPRQKEFVEKSVAALAEYGNTLGVAPTGAGKTVMMGGVADSLLKKYQVRTGIVLQHSDELVAQNRLTFWKFNNQIQSDLFTADRKRWVNGGWTFAMVQTLSRDANLDSMPAVEALFIDEAHHVAATSYRKIIDRALKLNPDLKIFGVTATPNRGDRKALRSVFTNCSDQITLRELIAAGFLVRPRTFVVDIGVQGDLRGVKKLASDFDMAEVEKIMDKEVLNERVVEEWRKLAGDRRTVVFCSTVAHAAHVADAFRSAGIRTGVVTGEMADGERQATLKAFDAGELQVLVNVAVLTEGWDCLDDETEVLTPAGWKRRGGINIGDAVYGWDHATGDIRECRVLDVGSRPVRSGERMLEIESQHVNIRVTEGHRMFVEKNRRGGFKEVLARDLSGWASEYAIPLSGNADFPGVPLSDDEIRLVAWHTTDGYLTKGGRLEIYQTEDKHADHIASLIDRLEMKSWSFVRNEKDRGFGNAKPLRTFVIGKRQLGRVYKYLDKNLSPLLMQMSREQFIVFWNELLLGDGEGSHCLCVGRREFADKLNQMAVLRGFASSISVRERPSGTSYRVFVRDKKKLNSLPGDTRSARMNLVPSRSGEMVWCVTNELGTIVTRRRGKVAIVGNCQPVSCVILLRPSSFKSTMVQMIGRGLRKVDPERYPGIQKDDCIVIDFGTSILTHGAIEDEVDLEGGGTKSCPECEAIVPRQSTECPICGHGFPKMLAPTKACGECGHDNGLSARECKACGAPFPERDTEKGQLDKFVLTEVDLLQQSPFKWETLFDGIVMVASAFDAWAMIIHYYGRWYAIGSDNKHGMRLLLDSTDRIMALASADDFMRENGDTESARKTKRWLNEPATEKQCQALQINPMNAFGLTRYKAACHITWKWNERAIRKKLEGLHRAAA